MNINDIDWNGACLAQKPSKFGVTTGSTYWDKRAKSFARHNIKNDYVDKFLRCLKIRKDWTVLDVGCATGTLAVPLAQRVRSVTAMDISAGMLTLLSERCRTEGVDNIRIIRAGWEDDWTAAGIGQHDIAIASRSLITNDYRSALSKLDKAARKRVYLSTLVGDGPHDRQLFEAIGRPLNPGPDYIYFCNLLYQMGIRAGVSFVSSVERNAYNNPEEAFEIIRLRFGDLNRTEAKALKAYLEKYLHCRDGKWQMAYRRKIVWAVLSWEKT